MTPEEFSRVLHLESEGNASSAASEWDTAEDYYKKAIAIFESRTCVTYTGIEREKLVELLSNRSATLSSGKPLCSPKSLPQSVFISIQDTTRHRISGP